MAIEQIVSVMLREKNRFWIAAGAAGGSELPAAAEPFRMRVALPVAIGKSLGWTPEQTAQLGERSSSIKENLDGWLDWMRSTVELPEGSFAVLGLDSQQGQLAAARTLEAAVGIALFADFEVKNLTGRKPEGPGGDWASPSRDPADLVRLFALLEAKAIERCAPESFPAKADAPRL